MGDSVEIHDVTPEGAERLRAFLDRDRLQGHEADSGTVKGDCIDVSFKYDREAGALQVTPERLPDHLQGENALEEMLRTAMATATTLPGRCGVLTYGLFEIDNESGLALTYSKYEADHGTVEANSSLIETGKTELAFTAESVKSSAVGISGTVTYGLADNVTSVTFEYYMLTAASARLTVGFTGVNAARYKAVSEKIEGFMDGYTYMTPKTTISKRS